MDHPRPDAFRKNDLVSAASRPLTVVTGGGRGIGAATVAHLVRHGHDVVLGYLSDRVAADEVVTASRAVGARALAVRGDVVDEYHVEALFAAAAVLGPVTGLVNNAGRTAHLGEFAETPVPVVRRVGGGQPDRGACCAPAARLR